MGKRGHSPTSVTARPGPPPQADRVDPQRAGWGGAWAGARKAKAPGLPPQTTTISTHRRARMVRLLPLLGTRVVRRGLFRLALAGELGGHVVAVGRSLAPEGFSAELFDVGALAESGVTSSSRSSIHANSAVQIARICVRPRYKFRRKTMRFHLLLGTWNGLTGRS
jgi:hypothetical protein